MAKRVTTAKELLSTYTVVAARSERLPVEPATLLVGYGVWASGYALGGEASNTYLEPHVLAAA
jgi:hypothetical protein